MTDVENGIGSIVRTLNEQDEMLARGAQVYPPPTSQPTAALPDYVRHQDGATRAGMMSAHVIAIEFEAAAKEVEKLGEELKAAQERAEEAQLLVADALKHLADTARAYRTEAAEAFNYVEHVTAKASEAVALCATLASKVATK